MEEKIPVKLFMADKYYPLRVEAEEEEMIREAAKQVNLWMNEYRKLHPTMGKDEILTMVAYQFSLEKLRLKRRNDTAPYAEKVQELTELLDDYLNEK
ncbi:MAG: cell division protein ZapA [Mediterranea sp.]|nr:cell division protein ZapA [Mediterranea sp.]